MALVQDYVTYDLYGEWNAFPRDAYPAHGPPRATPRVA
jgi:hypothetical protein